jgi:beta-lactamase regulating signal transducer with metallopeptidase domain
MSLPGIIPEVLATLARASVEGALFVAAVWLVCRLVPRLPAAVRCGLWWAACLKMLLGLAALPAVRLPLLPAPDPAPAARVVLTPRVAQPLQIKDPGSFPPAVPISAAIAEAKPVSPRAIGAWTLAVLWIAGLLILAVKALGQFRRTRRIVRSAEPVEEGGVRAAFAEICARLGLRRAPGLRGSSEVRTPQITGLAAPVVLIPRAGLARLTPAEVAMTLCHELVHLRRKDLWLGWVPALAHRLFFFHPLAALAVREYAVAREAACDAEVLRVLGSAPQAYGRLLLRWGVAPRETGLAVAGASPSLQNLKRRLQMLQQTSNATDPKRRVSGWWWLAAAAVVVSLVPVSIVAQERAPRAEEAAAAPAAPAAETPEPPAGTPVAADAPEPAEAPEGTPAPEPASVREGVEGGIPGGVEGGVAGGVEGGVEGAIPAVAPVARVAGGESVPAVAPVPPPPGPARAPRAPRAAMPAPPSPRTPRAAIAPLPPAPPAATPRPALAPVPPPPHTRLALATPMPAPTPRPAPLPVATPRAQLAALATPPPPPAPPAPPKPPKAPKAYGYHYSTGDGESYVFLSGDGSITMSGSSDEIGKVKHLQGSSKEGILWFRHGGKEYVIRDAALLKQAKELFKAQSELGAKQGELGGRQGALGARQGELGAKQGSLGAEMATLGSARARRGSSTDDRDLDRREKELSAKMTELGHQQEALGRQQEELGRQQEALGRQQEELGRKAETEMRSLMDRAVQSGAAQEVK